MGEGWEATADSAQDSHTGKNADGRGGAQAVNVSHLRRTRREPGEGVGHGNGHHSEEVLGRLVELAEALPRLSTVFRVSSSTRRDAAGIGA